MDKRSIYEQIVEAVRQELLGGRLRPGDALPSVREMAARWQCTPGTVQQAYKELARQGIAISRPGRGTHIGSAVLTAGEDTPLRRASMVHLAEAFLLEMLSAGYTIEETEGAFRAALDRWRALSGETTAVVSAAEAADLEAIPAAAYAASRLRFSGSHDPAVSLLAARFPDVCQGCTLHVAYPGSLGGLIALAEGKADIAGCHLWDAESDTYNVPFVRRLLPQTRVALVTLAHRRLGLMTPPGNPAGVREVRDLARRGVRFVNRQRGAGTRVWLDAQLRLAGLAAEDIAGYDSEVTTHAEIARAIVEGRANSGLGIETAAIPYGLGFVRLIVEPYHLAISERSWALEPVQRLIGWVASDDGRAAIAALGGYETGESGKTEWIED